MSKKVGRPKKSVMTKRIQCIMPEEILQILDKRIKTLPKNEQDRSRVITMAVNEWLGLKPKRREYSNPYSDFFENMGNLNFEGIQKVVLNKLINKEILNENETKAFNELLAKLNVNIDESFRINSTSASTLILVEQLLLNTHKPITDYMALCKECGNIFTKKRKDQKYCCLRCKLADYERQKDSAAKDINKAVESKEANEINDEQSLNERENVLGILRLIDAENIVEKGKRLFNAIAKSSDSRFAYVIYVLSNTMEEMGEFSLFFEQFCSEYRNELISKFDLTELEAFNKQSFAEYMANDIFEDPKIKTGCKRWLVYSITDNYFSILKDLVISEYKSDNDLGDEDIEIAISKALEYFQNKYEEEYDTEYNRQWSLHKLANIEFLKTKQLDYMQDQENKIIEAQKLLKENDSNLGVHYLLIDEYWNKNQWNEVIEHYKSFCRVKDEIIRIQNDNNSTLGFEKCKQYLLALPDYIELGNLVTGMAAFAYAKLGQYEEYWKITKNENIRDFSHAIKFMFAITAMVIYQNQNESRKEVIELLKSLNFSDEYKSKIINFAKDSDFVEEDYHEFVSELNK